MGYKANPMAEPSIYSKPVVTLLPPHTQNEAIDNTISFCEAFVGENAIKSTVFGLSARATIIFHSATRL